jgi:hypothetical protein
MKPLATTPNHVLPLRLMVKQLLLPQKAASTLAPLVIILPPSATPKLAPHVPQAGYHHWGINE